MKRKLLKTIDLLTDNMVPDNYDEIIKKTTGVNVMKKQRKNIKVWKMATAVACCAILAIATFSFINMGDNSFIAPNSPNDTPNFVSQRESNSTLNSNDLETFQLKFNDFAIYTTKIGGVRREVEFSEIQEKYKVKELPYEIKCYLLCDDNETSTNNAFAGKIVYSTNEAWFSCLISENEIVEPINEKSEYSYLGNSKLILSKTENHYYAIFEIDGTNFAIEAEGYNDDEFVDVIKGFITGA